MAAERGRMEWTGVPGVWHVKSGSRKTVYECDIYAWTCSNAADTWDRVSEPLPDYGCEDSKSGRSPVCWHLFAALFAETGRVTRDEQPPAREPLRAYVERKGYVWEKDRKPEPALATEEDMWGPPPAA